MKIDIAHIAALAKLEIAPEQMEKFERDMKSIMDMFDQLPEVSDTLTPDREHPMRLRPDTAQENKFTRAQMLSNAPAVQSGCLVVPKTVE